MPDFLLELLSEEIPARMQAKASADLARLFEAELGKAGLRAGAVETFVTPRRLALIARDLPAATEPVREEVKGPRASAPPQALEGFLRKTGLTREQLEERDGILFAITDKPGRPTANVLAEAIPIIIRAFPWPKSMRWGAESASTESLRWVRPLQGIVALLGERDGSNAVTVDFEIAGVRSGAATVGHRFHHPGIITIGSAMDYAEKLRACHVIVDPAERRRIIEEGAQAAAAGAGLALVEDEGLLAENAGLTEWPVPLLGRFDPAFLDVPREVIQLTMRTNQKYFACTVPPRNGEGDRRNGGGGGAVSGADLAPNFVCTANIDATDGGAAIVAGNERVLSARLSDAKFFWEQDLKVPLEKQAAKLDQIVFHEELGTVADKVERVAKLARWLVEEGIVKPNSSPERGGGPPAKPGVEGAQRSTALETGPLHHEPVRSAPHRAAMSGGHGDLLIAAGPPPRSGEERGLAALAERAARLAKADLVTGLVGEFPELQGVIGGHLARAQGEPPEVADAIRDHYKPVGQGDEVPTAPVTVAVSLADKLDTLLGFFAITELPTGSKDPYALRRSALAIIGLIITNGLRIPLNELSPLARAMLARDIASVHLKQGVQSFENFADDCFNDWLAGRPMQRNPDGSAYRLAENLVNKIGYGREMAPLVTYALDVQEAVLGDQNSLIDFFADRLKIQQREAGVRHDLIDAVFVLGNEDDVLRLITRVRALQTFVETPEGTDLLAGYKRAANILKKENWAQEPTQASARPERSRGALAGSPSGRPSTSLGTSEEDGALPYAPLSEEAALIAALDAAEPRARAAVEAEDFEGAMAALASLRAPVDAFFDKVTVNDPDPVKREARLNLLARMRDAVHQVADFSRIEG